MIFTLNKTFIGSHQRCSTNRDVLKISQNSKENTCVRAPFNRIAGLSPATLLNKETPIQLFSCKFY